MKIIDIIKSFFKKGEDFKPPHLDRTKMVEFLLENFDESEYIILEIDINNVAEKCAIYNVRKTKQCFAPYYEFTYTESEEILNTIEGCINEFRLIKRIEKINKLKNKIKK